MRPQRRRHAHGPAWSAAHHRHHGRDACARDHRGRRFAHPGVRSSGWCAPAAGRRWLQRRAVPTHRRPAVQRRSRAVEAIGRVAIPSVVWLTSWSRCEGIHAPEGAAREYVAAASSGHRDGATGSLRRWCICWWRSQSLIVDPRGWIARSSLAVRPSDDAGRRRFLVTRYGILGILPGRCTPSPEHS